MTLSSPDSHVGPGSAPSPGIGWGEGSPTLEMGEAFQV